MYYDQGLTDAAYGSLIQIRNMDMTSNNLANSATGGYKADRLVFDDELSRQLKTDFSQGSLRETGNKLDLALSGEGFFMIKTPEGDRLTRNGTFQMTAQGGLVTPEGNPVLDNNRTPITLNPTGGDIYVDQQGNISQEGEQVATIAVVEPNDLGNLMKDGRTSFMSADGNLPEVTPGDSFSVTQGALEMSNVNIVKQMVSMITAQRAFESYQKAIHSLSEIDEKAVNQVGKV